MTRKSQIFLTVALFGWATLAYSQSGAQSSAQTSASTQSSASATADKSGVQASGSSDTSASAKAGRNSAQLDSGTTMNAVLSHSLDARKNKPGDAVTAKSTQAVKSQGRVIVPKGAILVGHVTQAQAREQGESKSSLGVVFDHAVLKNGQFVPLNMNIRAIAAAETVASSSLDQDALSAGGSAASSANAGANAGGGLVGGATSTAGAGLGAVGSSASNMGGTATGAVSSTSTLAGNTAGSVSSSTSAAAGASTGGLNSAGQLTSNSRGVFGLQGLGLTSASSGEAQGTLITSASRNVHLESGTRLLLAAQGQIQASKQDH